MNNIIELSNVKLIKDSKLLLDDINLVIQKSENWIIFGSNGSGKTLLLQLIEGYMHPSGGTIIRYGEKIGECDLREFRRKTGFLSSSLKQIMHRNENVLEAVISGKFASIGIYDSYSNADKDKALSLLKITNALDLKDRAFGHLSDGEKERVLIARALMNDPELIILDEPCSNLDIKAREDFLGALENVHHQHLGISILMVTHHTDEILSLFTHMLVMKSGRVFYSGSVSETLTSDKISRALDIPLTIHSEYGRFWSHVNQ